jgi:MFS family permease
MKKLLELPAFRRLLAVAMLNEMAFSVGAVALALLVYRRTGSAIGAAAFFLSTEFAPAFIAPVLVSRLDQRAANKVLSTLHVAEAVIFGFLAWIVGNFGLIIVLVLALLDGTLAVTARVLVRAAWTSVSAPLGLIREANAVINGGYSVCFMLGPALGGAIVAAAGTRAALLANSGVFLISALTIATATGLPERVKERESFPGRLRAAANYVRQEPGIRRLLSLQALGLIFFTLSIPVEVVFAQHTLRAGAGGYGALLAAWGGGAIVGSAMYARWRNQPSRTLISLGSFLLGAGFLIMSTAPNLAVAIVGAVLAGGGNGSQVVAMRSALQETVSERWMALVLSFDQSMFEAVPGVGIVLGGAIATLAGPRAAFGTAAAGSLVLSALMWIKLGVLNDPALQSPATPEAAVDDPELTAAVRKP